MAKIAISVPDEMLQAIETERRVNGETRSEFFRRAVEAYLRRIHEREQDEQYIRGYQQFPETEEDLGGLETLASEALAQEPWEREQGDPR